MMFEPDDVAVASGGLLSAARAKVDDLYVAEDPGPQQPSSKLLMAPSIGMVRVRERVAINADGELPKPRVCGAQFVTSEGIEVVNELHVGVADFEDRQSDLTVQLFTLLPYQSRSDGSN